MGCASSKIDDLPAVILCRDRLHFLSQALHHRYLLSEAHISYIHSLHSLSLSFHRFFDSSSSIPHLKLDPPPSQPPSTVVGPAAVTGGDSGHLSNSNSGSSHLHFHSDDEDDEGDDDDDDSGSDSLHHHHQEDGGGGGGGMGGFNPYLYSSNGVGGGYNNMQVNYMKKNVTPSVSYEQKPVSYYTETVQFGDPTASSSSNYYDYYSGNHDMNMNMNMNMHMNYNGNVNNGYMNYGGYGGGGYGGGGYGGYGQGRKEEVVVPPPPPAPTTSGWDFMNLFESIETHYPPYTPSRDSREVREEEGIPDLEDEDNENEVVKEVVHGVKKLVEESNSGSSVSGVSGEGKGGESKRVEEEDEEEVVVVGTSEGGGGESGLYNRGGGGGGRVSVSSESAPVEYEVHMVDKKVVGSEGGKSEQQGKGGGRPVFRDVFEVVKEIQVQFERAASSGAELGKVLEVGKLRYHRKNAAFQVSAKMLNVITPSLPSSSKDDASIDVDEEVQLRSVNLSATLQKLYLWEKKLFEEVKIEEKMRVHHDRKVEKLKHLTEKGAEHQKIDSTRSTVRSLSTKIRIAIQIVDKISAKINKLRDEELWPQLNELIQGLSRMWKAMLECHHSQCEAIDGARGLDAIAFPSNPSDTHLEASLQLQHDLLNWTCRFTEWIGAQKGYVRALNCWLLKCILYEPEETPDGRAPFSPGRAGAPPVFVICNQWDQSLERISETSERELIDSMRVFSMMVLHFRERDKGELKQRMNADRDMERKVKNMEKEDIKIQKKMVLASGESDGLSLSGHVVYQSDTSSKTSLQAGLRHVFEAMERFTADSVKVYEELLQRTEDLLRQHGNIS